MAHLSYIHQLSTFGSKKGMYSPYYFTHLLIDSSGHCIIATSLESLKSKTIASIQFVVFIFSISAQTSCQNSARSSFHFIVIVAH